MDYVIVVEAPAYRVSPTTFATESAFAHHLCLLAARLAPRFEQIHLVAPSMSQALYDRERAHLSEIGDADGISFWPMQEVGGSVGAYWLRAPSAFRSLWRVVRGSGLVHAGLSSNLSRPLGFVATLFALFQRKHSVFVVDIDFRGAARMNYLAKRWSLKSYLLCRHLYDPLRVAQIRLATRYCSLVLLKSPRMVHAFGGERECVKDFFDAAHSPEHVIDAAEMARREARLEREDAPLRLVYFGRLVDYKGVDLTIRAVRRARMRSGRDFRLRVIGAGEGEAGLRNLVAKLGMEDAVTFSGAVPYGPLLFRELADADLLLATPRSEDTPRSAFDALAAGIPIAAFDLSYYRDLEQSGAVVTAPWLEVKSLANRICQLDADRDRMKEMMRSAVEFARANTQDVWLERRVGWTFELLEEPRYPVNKGRLGSAPGQLPRS